MRRKIFKKSNKSKIRLDLNPRSANWWLRSSYLYYNYDIGYIGIDGNIYYYRFSGVVGILPVCIIWWMSWDGKSSRNQINLGSDIILVLCLTIGDFGQLIIIMRPVLDGLMTSVRSSTITIPAVSFPSFRYVQFDEHFLDFWYNWIMIQKIFMLSDKFKMRRDLEFIYRPQLIRSAHDVYTYFVGFVSHRVTYNNVKIDFGILPVCTIWKLISLSISSK